MAHAKQRSRLVAGFALPNSREGSGGRRGGHLQRAPTERTKSRIITVDRMARSAYDSLHDLRATVRAELGVGPDRMATGRTVQTIIGKLRTAGSTEGRIVAVLCTAGPADF